MQRDRFGPDIIDKARSLGAQLDVVERLGGNQMGFWVGLHIDPHTGAVTPGKIRKLDGIAVGY